MTMIWLLSWVSSLVLLQAAWSRKYCRTLYTRKWWFLRLPTSKYVFWHSLQEYGSSPEWHLWWFHRLPVYKNVFRHFFYNNSSLSSKILNESSDVLLEKMSLSVLYKNMVSPWMCSLVYLQKTSWEYLLRFTMSLTIKVYCSTLEID